MSATNLTRTYVKEVVGDLQVVDSPANMTSLLLSTEKSGNIAIEDVTKRRTAVAYLNTNDFDVFAIGSEMVCGTLPAISYSLYMPNPSSRSSFKFTTETDPYYTSDSAPTVDTISYPTISVQQ